MIEIDNKKLDLLLSLRNMICNDDSLVKNNAINIDFFNVEDHDYESSCIYNRLLDYIKQRYEKDKLERETIIKDLNNIIDKTCDHKYVEDEIEHVYSGSLTRIRYCSICEKTA